MTWLKLDDGFDEHPKIVDLSDAAFRLHVSLLCYCARNLTDGRVKRGIVRQRGTDGALEELVEAGLLHETDNGFLVHDFLEFNPSREQVEAGRERGRERQARSRSRRMSRRDSGRDSREASRVESRRASPGDSARPVPVPDPGDRVPPSEAHASRARAKVLEPSPHPPSEPEPATRKRGAVDPVASAVAAGVRRLDEARGHPVPLGRHAGAVERFVRQAHGSAWLDAVEAFVADEWAQGEGLPVAALAREPGRWAAKAKRRRRGTTASSPRARAGAGPAYRRLLEAARGAMVEQTIRTWLEPCGSREAGGGVVIVAPNPLFAEWIDRQYLEILREIAKREGLPVPSRVEVEDAPEAVGAGRTG